MPRRDRRREILDAALTCFLERSYLATSISDIRVASGASTGSIYHFFGNKAAIALALIDEAVAGWSGASRESFDPDVSAERAIKSSVRGLVSWGVESPLLLRFMDEIRTISNSDPDFANVRAVFDAGRNLGEKQYNLFVQRGEVKQMAFVLAHSLMLGPAYNYLRMAGAGRADDSSAPEILASAAWAAVRA